MLDYSYLTAIGQKRPLLHCISNTVTANDCANLALAVGASPMMAQAPEEMADIAAIAGAAVVNTGTPGEEKFRACLICVRENAAAGRPVVLDPVGVGASARRRRRVGELLEAASPAILRVNLEEARALLGRADRREHGVDSVSPAGAEERAALAAALAERYHTAALLSGAEDVISDGARAWRVSGGSSMTGRITGAGCMLSVLCGAFAAVAEDAAEAAVLAAAFWKVCARRAEEASAGRGTAGFRAALLDEASTLKEPQFAKAAGELIKEIPAAPLFDQG